jgi:hypothetical protein
VLFIAVSSPGQQTKFDFRQAGGDAALRGLFATFMNVSGNRTDDLEHAAFLVRASDGNLSCVQWPYANWERARIYRRVIPEGTVAILRVQAWRHQRPTSEDIAQSVRSGLPVYTLTRWHIYAVDPASGETEQIVSREDWSRGLTASADGRCSLMKNWRPIAKRHRPLQARKEP